LLQDKSADLSMKIEEGFGPNGLGILSISDVWDGLMYKFIVDATILLLSIYIQLLSCLFRPWCSSN
jgi:hypothetical protein